MITADDLYTLEEYDKVRPEFRARVLAAKSTRQVQLGEHLRILFENRLTVLYQIQEMLRIEKIFKANEIEEEIEAYAPLVSDRDNLKATIMLEYPDVNERKQKLSELIGIERKIYMQVEELDKVFPVANEDLERETEDKTSAVHFIRFPLSEEIHAALDSDKELKFGVEHEKYDFELVTDNDVRNSLLQDITV